MKEDILKFLACPKKTKKKACLNGLVLDEVFSFFDSHPKEVKEGYLKCKSCTSRFPIYFGIPVLTSSLSKYLRDNFYVILELSKRYGPSMDKRLLADSLLLAKQAKPKDKRELFERTKKQYKKRIKDIFENEYIINYYDNILALAKSNEPLYDFLKRYKDKTPHLVLEGFLKSHSNSKDPLALEVGCNAGGFLKTLSKYAGSVFGLDNSFEDLFFASCLLRHLPVKIDRYKVIVEGDIKKNRPLSIKVVDNLTLIAGEGDNLPFRNFSLSIVLSCNLIDIIDKPRRLFKEKIRVLKKGGLFLSSDPYQFLGENRKRLRIKRNQTPWQAIQELLRPKIKIVEERDNIPWLTRTYKRNYNVYYNHSFCGKRVC